jgi:MoaA/NifB/PqqE/SkfB family radical SAM enzyme
MENQPVFLFEVTQKCGYQCKPCFENILVANEQDEMKLWEWLIIIESIAEQNGRLIISGGDPFLRTDIIDLVSYAKVLGIEVELATCGLNLTPNMLTELKRVGLDGVIIRMDGVTEEENDEYRGVRTYAEAVAALKQVQSFGINVSLVISSDASVESLEKAYAFSKENGVRLFISTLTWRGAPALIRSRKWEMVQSTSDDTVLGTVIHPDGKVYSLDGGGLRYTGEIQEVRYRLKTNEEV